ncbi:hypothetical protein PAXRUDRAFT_619515 [Paxillus rubicundulus Ve08.2h10]|uniref:Uncharacterized protein n=1 Tax=Paxillus rubicundulus Ve08.2h10 TaxID=930991 RepID=A0A0D0DYF9_9AGAM|nr:hypothetical protein PAXRUDRAFT_619515 [Paxillus rubicundulus Ve08.2h10]
MLLHPCSSKVDGLLKAAISSVQKFSLRTNKRPRTKLDHNQRQPKISLSCLQPCSVLVSVPIIQWGGTNTNWLIVCGVDVRVM